jgi:hypothetical protein
LLFCLNRGGELDLYLKVIRIDRCGRSKANG